MQRRLFVVTRIAVATACVAMMTGTAAVAQESSDSERFWPQWRGPLGTGVAPHGAPPVEWGETTNVRWKVEIPERGSGTPVIWDDRLFVLTAVPTGAPSPSRDGLFTRLRRRILGGCPAL